jgi:hypothetical protein
MLDSGVMYKTVKKIATSHCTDYGLSAAWRSSAIRRAVDAMSKARSEEFGFSTPQILRKIISIFFIRSQTCIVKIKAFNGINLALYRFELESIFAETF